MKCRIHNNQPNAAQRKVLRAECVKEFDKLLAEFNREVALQVLYILRFDFGFGQERLKKFADKLAEMQNNTVHRYEVKDGEIPDICEIKLRDSGIDVDKIL
ncbi:MAG: hypothetical protein UHO61_07495 [Acutalibacteraceae bacterium]|nr:hypothetical protein [Acutalibacteraceae bacterium]